VPSVLSCADAVLLSLLLQIRDIGSGNFGVAKLMRNRTTNELVAVKFIERGERVRRRSTGVVHQRLGQLFGPAAVAP
jgi:hypothetical protein